LIGARFSGQSAREGWDDMSAQYYFSHDGKQQQGPVSLEELRQAGVTLSTTVWRDGMPGWAPARDVPEVARILTTWEDAPARAVEPATVVQPAPQPVAYQHPQGYANTRPQNGLAIASMILGIISIPAMCGYFVGGLFPGVLAIVFGHVARAQIRRDQSTGDGMAVAGLVMGYISTIVGLVAIVILILFFIGMIATASSGGRGGF
jgi:hypothetical protein